MCDDLQKYHHSTTEQLSLLHSQISLTAERIFDDPSGCLAQKTNSIVPLFDMMSALRGMMVKSTSKAVIADAIFGGPPLFFLGCHERLTADMKRNQRVYDVLSDYLRKEQEKEEEEMHDLDWDSVLGKDI